ncbi:MAG TPA: hypothetical protein VJ752_17045 [Burkholderiaceae bacterium]|nr:hypothetical protein [Burkholderiaceae bacterium]
MNQVARFPWNGFPDVLIHSPERLVKQHRAYVAAKAGDAIAAAELVWETLSLDILGRLWDLFDERRPILVSAHADEASGVNAIPEALANAISVLLKWPRERDVIQANVVGHTGANGYVRLQRQVLFSGIVPSGLHYVLVDDFIGQGGTLANLRGHILKQGSAVLGATVLTGKAYSASLALTDTHLAELRRKHGTIEFWWKQRFGFGFECLTASEARYLIRTPTSARIIARLEEIAGER